jgi:hypothetical protein
MTLNTIYNAIDSKVSEQINDLDRAHKVWTRLEETYEGTPAVKSAKLYILKDKLTSFEIKDDESILEMFHRLIDDLACQVRYCRRNMVGSPPRGIPTMVD